MWLTLRLLWQGGRTVVLTVALAFIVGYLLGTLSVPVVEPDAATTPVASITPHQADRLADALEALAAPGTTVPPAAEPLIDQAEEVTEGVRTGTVLVTPTTTSSSDPAPPVTAAAPAPTTVPTTAPPADDPLRWIDPPAKPPPTTIDPPVTWQAP